MIVIKTFYLVCKMYAWKKSAHAFKFKEKMVLSKGDEGSNTM